jgi:hypothetical protein
VIGRHRPYLQLAAQDSPELPVGALSEHYHRNFNKLLVREQELAFLKISFLMLISVLTEPCNLLSFEILVEMIPYTISVIITICPYTTGFNKIHLF